MVHGLVHLTDEYQLVKQVRVEPKQVNFDLGAGSTLKVIQQTWSNFDDIDYFKVSWLRDTSAADHGKILGIEAHWMNGFFMTCGKIQQKPEIGIFSVSDPLELKTFTGTVSQKR